MVDDQEALCARYGYAPQGDTNGWYIWAGEELRRDPDFFEPLHVSHLAEWCPAVTRFLALAPGWRFLIAPDHEDIWFDASLLDLPTKRISLFRIEQTGNRRLTDKILAPLHSMLSISFIPYRRKNLMIR
jgi:hypothetical protein